MFQLYKAEGSEDTPSQQLPANCLDNVLDNPFVFDLIKSETYDWERNDRMYMMRPPQDNNPILGYLSGYLSEYVKLCQNGPMSCPNGTVYLPGRMNHEFMAKLKTQQ